MLKKTMKALMKINMLLDNEINKLYDTLENQKCCLERQEKLLLEWVEIPDNLLNERGLNLKKRTLCELCYPLYRKHYRKKK